MCAVPGAWVNALRGSWPAWLCWVSPGTQLASTWADGPANPLPCGVCKRAPLTCHVHLSCAGTQLVSAGADGLIKLWSVRLSGEAGTCVLSCVVLSVVSLRNCWLVHTATQCTGFDGHGVKTPPRHPPSRASPPPSPASPRLTKPCHFSLPPTPQNASTPLTPMMTRCGH